MKIVLTGSSSGIGRYLAGHLLAQGHEVCGLARSPQDEFEATGHAKGQQFSFYRCDVANWVQVSESAAKITQSWGRLDALICCSGTQAPIGPAMNCDPVAWSQNIRVNLDGTFFTIRAFFALLQRASGRGKVLCFSGGGATSPRPHFSAYGAGKCAVVRLVETLAHEWVNENVDINAIAPGAIYTKMTEQTLASGPGLAGEKEYQQALELKKKGEEPLKLVGGLVDALISSKSNGISGRLLSAPWDAWSNLEKIKDALKKSDVYTLRRIRPEDRNLKLG